MSVHDRIMLNMCIQKFVAQDIFVRAKLEGGVVAVDAEWKPFQAGSGGSGPEDNCSYWK